MALHTTPNLTLHDDSEAAFLAAMTDTPGDGLTLMVFADWLEEHDRPALAEAVRANAPIVVNRYRRAAECLDALLSADPARVAPVRLPSPDRGDLRSRRQWVSIVKAALLPLRLRGITVVLPAAWRNGGVDVVLRLPGCDLRIGDGSGGGLAPPWGLSSAGMLEAGVLAFSAIMPALFPNESARVVYDDGDTFSLQLLARRNPAPTLTYQQHDRERSHAPGRITEPTS